MSESEWVRPDASDEFLIALGAVAYWSARVEGRLFWLAASFIDPGYDGWEDPDDRALAATRGMGFDPLTQLVKRCSICKVLNRIPTCVRYSRR
jgi:hypothetical protein